MQTLRPGQWLGDEVINHLQKNCLARRDEKLCAKEPGRRRSHFFNSFFMQTMFDEKNNSPQLRESDETQRCQLCHYDVIVAQLAALGFIKSV